MPIDLRSDTITQPTPEMREVMAQAVVGDDVFGDDPTVLKLEKTVAEFLGKEAAAFTPSGTMANQLALRALTEPGDEILIDANAHIYYYESGGPAALAGVMCHCLPGVRGVFTAANLEAALRPADQHFASSKLVCLENTHNRGGGKVWPIETDSGSRRQRAGPRPAAPSGWRTLVECGGGHRHPRARLCRPL